MSDDTLYLYTSLTAGSSHIITATSRVETILKAHKIPFKAIDCATDEKARKLWGRRSKDRKLPGLVKYGDILADYDQVEEWNEYGELKDQIEAVDDMFGDAPATETTAEDQAVAAAKASEADISNRPSRAASETRHISISDPKDKSRDGSVSQKEDTPLAIAMRQASAEAAAKAGQRKASSTAASKPASKDATEVDKPAPAAAAESKLEREMEEPTTENTEAKAPTLLAAEGAKRTSVDKIQSTLQPEGIDLTTTKSNEEQVLEQTRRGSVPQHKSSLARETSISEVSSTDSPTSRRTSFSEPAKEHRGSSLEPADPDMIKKIEQANAIEEEDEESEGSGKGGSSKKEKVDLATKAKISASDKAEAEATEGTKPQEQKTKDEDAAGVSVGD